MQPRTKYGESPADRKEIFYKIFENCDRYKVLKSIPLEVIDYPTIVIDSDLNVILSEDLKNYEGQYKALMVPTYQVKDEDAANEMLNSILEDNPVKIFLLYSGYTRYSEDKPTDLDHWFIRMMVVR